MGKKSKRSKPSSSSSSSKKGGAPRGPKKSPSSNVETLENLMFQDPYEDDFIEEETTAIDGQRQEGQDYEEDHDKDRGAAANAKEAWTPSMGMSPSDVLSHDPSAYKMFHTITPTWPSLTFSIVSDENGCNRSRFPHDMTVIVGDQAGEAEKCGVTVMRMRNLCETYKKSDDSDDDPDAMDESDDDDDDQDEDKRDVDPDLDAIRVNHAGTVNRLRIMPSDPSSQAATGKKTIIATMSESKTANIWDLTDHCSALSSDASGSRQNLSARSPVYVHDLGGFEGYALDWSVKNRGVLATGDCGGNITVFNPSQGGSWATETGWKCQSSVEDLQWSPTESTVFASCDCSGKVSIFDVRSKPNPMISCAISSTDVNVISWSEIVTNLLASGDDNGNFSVYDLRKFSPTASPSPLARFSSSRDPITSVDWHPTDESMVLVSTDNSVCVYDLSVESEIGAVAGAAAAEGDDKNTKGNSDVVPPQMLFMHCGGKMFKDAQWHKQITSAVVATSQTGIDVFIPSNL